MALKNNQLFFDGKISEYFNGSKDLYIGDMDFKFADKHVNISAEIKTISKDNTFTGKKVSLNQAREYAATVGMFDNYGRQCMSYLFEYHKYAKNPFVVVVPFKRPTRNETVASELLDIENARMMYVDKDKQICQWLSGSRYIGAEMWKPLLCI